VAPQRRGPTDPDPTGCLQRIWLPSPADVGSRGGLVGEAADVNLAARVAAHARGGEVLVSALLKDLTRGAREFRFDDGREAELKGLAGRHRVFALDWEQQVTAA
jgi:adenylate cyclase